MKTKLSPKFWCALTLFSLVGQIAWVVENMYLNVFIYKMFNATAANISAMVAASAVAATLTTVFIGALSDKIGKRKLFICGGYILWGISILVFAFIRTDIISPMIPATVSAATVGVTLVIILDCLMTFFGSSANDAAFNAWLTDSTDSQNRGRAEGINAIMPLVAMLAVFGGFMAFDLNLSESWTLIFIIIGVATTLIGILGFFIIEEPRIKRSEDGYLSTVIHGFLPSTVRKNPPFYIILFIFVVFNIAIQIFMPYLIIYFEMTLGMTNYVPILAPAIVLASAVTALWGRVYDKKGYFFSVTIALCVLIVGCFSLFLVKATAAVFAATLLLMCGYLAGAAVFGAKIRDLTPEGKSGRFQGVRICAQVLLPGVIGPYIGKTILSGAETVQNSDGTTSFLPTSDIFLGASVAVLLSLILVVITAALIQKKPPRLEKGLKTPYEEDTTSSWDDYPRPQFKRDSFFSLNGKWSLKLRSKDTLTPLGDVNVPFPIPSRLSGIDHQLKPYEELIYEREFTLPEGFTKDRTIINFGAVDLHCTLTVNGILVGSHSGGYDPFSFDITDQLKDGPNTLSLSVSDPLDKDYPYGKQKVKRGGMWYTPTSGIWQSVWLESLPSSPVTSLRITPSLNSVVIETEGGAKEKCLTLITEKGERIYTYEGDSFTLTPDDPRVWTPEDPYLYRFTLRSGEDKISSYFALRTFTVEKKGDTPLLCLNGSPIFCHGLLDQGYFSDGIFLPATPKGFEEDILRAKEMGFNMLRKHIKLEPEIFYYLCDKHGMLVFQDMINNGKYSFFLDTALPTVGLKRGISHKASPKRRKEFEHTARLTQTLLYNHPSVVYYTIFNEGWGQYDADRLYRELKDLDPSRVYDTTSGWFTEKESDVQSEHIYFRKLAPKTVGTRPLVISEFGGYSLRIPDHIFNLDENYGYKTYKNEEELTLALESLYLTEVKPLIEKGLSATVMTQISDVEDETNGLLTYDRQTIKVEPKKMKSISESLYSEFERIHN